MTTQEFHIIRKFVNDKGYQIYTELSGHNHYRLVVRKATKYSWSDIPRDKRQNYEEVDKIIYSRKVGEIEYKKNPSVNDEKFWEKIDELYLRYFESITKTKIDNNNIFKSIAITMNDKDLKNKYDSLCNEFAYRFCEKQGFQFKGWIDNFEGWIFECSGGFFDFKDILIDVSSNQRKGLVKPIEKTV